jgi:hypothetical protein
MTAKVKAQQPEKFAPDFLGSGLLTPEDVATLLQVTVNTLQNWRYNGRGPIFSRVGGIIRYTREDINTFVTSSRQSITGHSLALTL